MEAFAEPLADLESIREARRASSLLHPLRLTLVSLARQPASSTELARRLGLPRQRVHYHVRALVQAGFLRAAGRRRKRNMIEQRYVATARAYVLSPRILGTLAADWRQIEDTASPDYLLALAEQVRSDLEGASAGAGAGGDRLATLSVKSQFRFESPDQRAEFARAVRQALIEVIARHSSPNRRENGRPGRGQTYRLVLACYPVPAETEEGSKGGLR